MIHLYVHGRGRGHATRCLAIARALEAAGRPFRAFVGRDGVPMFSAAYECTPVESLPPTPGAAVLGLARRVREAIDAGRSDRVSAILSDGDLPGLLAAKALRKPSVAVGHGLVFSECKRPSSLPRTPWLREAAKAATSSVGAHRAIAVNFVPLEPRTHRVTLARPSLDPRLHRADSPSEVLCYFRDGAPDVLRMLVAIGLRPVVFATDDPGVEGIEYEPQSRERFIERMARARVVVASAGSQLISECVGLGIPMLALHRRDDDEQRLNAAMLKTTRLGDGCSFEALTQRRLERFVRSPPVPPQTSFDAPSVAEAAVAALGGYSSNG
ncbi:MAG: glycosyltransferase family protein [Nannocystaceae bacterium]|nr:glycosyltransferase [bacterium]